MKIYSKNSWKISLVNVLNFTAFIYFFLRENLEDLLTTKLNDWSFINISNYKPSLIFLYKHLKLPAKFNYPPISSQAPLGLPFSAVHSAQIVSTPGLPRARRFVSSSSFLPHNLITVSSTRQFSSSQSAVQVPAISPLCSPPCKSVGGLGEHRSTKHSSTSPLPSRSIFEYISLLFRPCQV